MKAIHGFNILVSIAMLLGAACNNGCLFQVFDPFVRSPSNKRAGFHGTRLAYYSNATCTFQLELLKSGDVHSNPGPQTTVNERTTEFCNTHKPSLRMSSQCSRAKSYSRTELLNLFHIKHSVTSSVWNTIRSLGINDKAKTRRGRKGGRNRRKKPNIASHQDRGGDGTLCKFGLWNARSMKAKTSMICDFIISTKLEVLALTETWLSGDDRDNCAIADIVATLPTHNFIHNPRKDRNGGVLEFVSPILSKYKKRNKVFGTPLNVLIL